MLSNIASHDAAKLRQRRNPIKSFKASWLVGIRVVLVT